MKAAFCPLVCTSPEANRPHPTCNCEAMTGHPEPSIIMCLSPAEHSFSSTVPPVTFARALLQKIDTQSCAIHVFMDRIGIRIRISACRTLLLFVTPRESFLTHAVDEAYWLGIGICQRMEHARRNRGLTKLQEKHSAVSGTVKEPAGPMPAWAYPSTPRQRRDDRFAVVLDSGAPPAVE